MFVAVSRLPPLLLVGCALLAALTLASGCGDGGGGDGGNPTSAGATTVTSQEDDRFQDPPAQGKEKSGNDAGRSAQSPRHVPAGDLCQSRLGSFVGSMDGLRRRLAVGVTYDQYVAEVRGVRSIYGEIPTRKLQIDCLTAVATPGEKAFNRYIEAANEWGECVSEAGCSSVEIEPSLQRRWRIASHFLSETQEGLRS